MTEFKTKPPLIDGINPEFLSRAEVAFSHVRLIHDWRQNVLAHFQRWPSAAAGLDRYLEESCIQISAWLPLTLAEVDAEFDGSMPEIFWDGNGLESLRRSAQNVRAYNKLFSTLHLRLPDAPKPRGYIADSEPVAIWSDPADEERFRDFRQQAFSGMWRRTLLVHGLVLDSIPPRSRGDVAEEVTEYRKALTTHALAMTLPEVDTSGAFSRFLYANAALRSALQRVSINPDVLPPILRPAEDFAFEYSTLRALCPSGSRLAQILFADAVTHCGILELGRHFKNRLFAWDGPDKTTARDLATTASVLTFDGMVCSRVLFALGELALVCMDDEDVKLVRGWCAEWRRSRHAHDSLMSLSAKQLDAELSHWADTLFPNPRR